MLTLLYLLTVAVTGWLALAAAQDILTEADKQEILDAHNNFRGMVSPPATNMQKMEWNDELAQIARDFTGQCVFTHNNERHSQSRSYEFVGENIKVAGGTQIVFTECIQLWYDEGTTYDYSLNTCSGECGHYTQVVWATSNMVGCGVKVCPSITGFSGQTATILVCNYGPAGNVLNQRPYERGTSCSNCPSDHPVCIDNLCTAEEPDIPTPETEITPSPSVQVGIEPGTSSFVAPVHTSTVTLLGFVTSTSARDFPKPSPSPETTPSAPIVQETSVSSVTRQTSDAQILVSPTQTGPTTTALIVGTASSSIKQPQPTSVSPGTSTSIASSQVDTTISPTTALPVPRPTFTPDTTRIQHGFLEGYVQGRDLPHTDITGTFRTKATVDWQVAIPEGFDYKLYAPIKFGTAIPYALVAALNEDSGFDIEAFTATTILTFPRGFQLIVEFVSLDTSQRGGSTFSVQANGFYNERMSFEGVSSVYLKLRQFINGIVAGSSVMLGNIRLDFKITGIDLESRSITLPPNLQVQFSSVGGTSRVLEFTTTSSFTEGRKRRATTPM